MSGVEHDALGLVGDIRAHDLAGGSFDDPAIGVEFARNQALAQPVSGRQDGLVLVIGDGVGREQHARHLAEHHFLHNDGHADVRLVEAVAVSVSQGALREPRRPASGQRAEHGVVATHEQEGVELARERVRSRILAHGTGADRHQRVLIGPAAQGVVRLGDDRPGLGMNRDALDECRDVGAGLPHGGRHVPGDAFQDAADLAVDAAGRHCGDEDLGGHDEPGRHAESQLSQPGQIGRLAPEGGRIAMRRLAGRHDGGMGQNGHASRHSSTTPRPCRHTILRHAEEAGLEG